MSNLLELRRRYAQHNVTLNAINNLGGNAPNRISTEGDRFSLAYADGRTVPLNTFKLMVMIVDVNPSLSRGWYAKAYTRKAGGKYEFPECFSVTGNVPSARCKLPQSHSCLTCPKSEYGSAPIRQGEVESKGKACREGKDLAVFVVDAAVKAIDPNFNFQTLWLLSIPPASLGLFRGYINAVGGATRDGSPQELFDVFTRLEITSDKRVQFSRVGQTDEGWIGAALQAVDAKDTRLLLDLDDKPHSQDSLARLVGAPAAPALAAPATQAAAPAASQARLAAAAAAQRAQATPAAGPVTVDVTPRVVSAAPVQASPVAAATPSVSAVGSTAQGSLPFEGNIVQVEQLDDMVGAVGL